MENIANYIAKSGGLVPVCPIEVQTVPDDTDRIVDAVMKVHPLRFSRYQRAASISALGQETALPEAGSTATTHISGFQAGGTETYPMVELKISIARDLIALSEVMDAMIHAHHCEEPTIFVREDWASRAAYFPQSSNPNR